MAFKTKDMDLRKSPLYLEGTLLLLISNPLRLRRSWKNRCLVINADTLCLYLNENDKEKGKILQEIPLLQSNVFQTVINHSRKQHVFVIECDGESYYFSCKDDSELDYWVNGCKVIASYWNRKREAQRVRMQQNMLKKMQKTILLNVEEDSTICITIPFVLCNGSEVIIKMSEHITSEEFFNLANEKVFCFVNPKICFVNKEGEVKLVNPSSKLYQESITKYYIVEPGYKVVVVFFKNGSFEELLLKENVYAKEILENTIIKDALRINGISNPGLFFQKTKHQKLSLCANDDEPMSFLFSEPEDLYPKGFLYVLNKELGFESCEDFGREPNEAKEKIATAHEISNSCSSSGANTTGYYPGRNFSLRRNSDGISRDSSTIDASHVQGDTSDQTGFSLKHEDYFLNKTTVLESTFKGGSCSKTLEKEAALCSNTNSLASDVYTVCFIEDFEYESQSPSLINENAVLKDNLYEEKDCSASVPSESKSSQLDINNERKSRTDDSLNGKNERDADTESPQILLSPGFVNIEDTEKKSINERAEKMILLHDKKMEPGTIPILRCEKCEKCSLRPLSVKNPQKMKVILSENSQSDIPRNNYLCLSGTHLYYKDGNWLAWDSSSISLSSESSDNNKLNFELGKEIVCKWVQEPRSLHRWEVVRFSEKSLNKESCPVEKHSIVKPGKNFSSKCLEESLEEAFQHTRRHYKQHKFNLSETGPLMSRINDFKTDTKKKVKTIRDVCAYSKFKSAKYFTDLIGAVILNICEVFDPFLDSERQIIGDDLKTPRIGWLIRQELCSAFKGFFTEGFRVENHLLKSLFSRVNPPFWTFIGEVSAANEAVASIIKDIESNRLFRNDDARFRAFLCQLIVRKCYQKKEMLLVVWLEIIPSMETVLEKYYAHDSFWRRVDCDEFRCCFEKLISITKKLNNYPFQLSLDFETRFPMKLGSSCLENRSKLVKLGKEDTYLVCVE